MNYAHPDSAESPLLHGSRRILRRCNILVSPVAGARTMLLRQANQEGSYLKLTYDMGRIGRVDRQLSLKHCLSSLEASATLRGALDAGALGGRCALMLERTARVSMLALEGGSFFEWGTIVRDRRPYPSSEASALTIPAFALVGRDRKAPGDPPLVVQMVQAGGFDPTTYLLELLTMTIDAYWKIVHSCGFHIEAHAQNCLFEFDSSFLPLRIVLKDMDSVEKDIPLQKFLGLRHGWDSEPYQCMTESQYYYPVRASYMFDFKLGYYLLDPLVLTFARHFQTPSAAIAETVREYVRSSYLVDLPESYFPADGCWYDCDNSEREPGKARDYFAHPNPKYR